MGQASTLGINRGNPIEVQTFSCGQGQQVADSKLMILVNAVEPGQLGFIELELGSKLFDGGGLGDLHPNGGGLDGRQGSDQKICWV